MDSTSAQSDYASAAPVASRTRRGVVDAVFQRLEQLPGSAIPWILGGAVALVVVGHLASWLSGEAPFGSAVPEYFYPVPFFAFFLMFIVIIDGVARSSFDEFAVSLDRPADVIAQLRADLTSIPDVPALIAVVVWTTLSNASGISEGPPEPPITGLLLVILWSLQNVALALVVVHTLRQLRRVGRLQAMADQVNLLDPGPINAFSRLTASTALAILLIDIAFAIVGAADASTFNLGAEIGIAALAAGFFALPLRGMHGRLEAERSRLLRDVNGRLQSVMDRVHQMVDSDDLGRADALQKAQDALLAERDLYVHASTWPWSTATFRGLASAIMLPIFIGIVLRLVGHVI